MRRSPTPGRAVRAGLAALGLASLTACGGPAAAAANPTPGSPGPATTTSSKVSKVIAPRGGVFSGGSAWGLQVRSSKEVAKNSAAQVSGLAYQVSSVYGGVAAYNAHQYDTSFVTAGKDTPTVDVRYDDCQGKGYEPPGLAGQFSNVPIPVGAVPSTGTDSEMTVYQPSTDRLWELWIMQRSGGNWHACYGGRIDHVSTSPGYFGGGFGASASGLATVGGMVGLADVRSGSIKHALALDIRSPAIYSRYSWPAQRSDGQSTSPDSIAEGTRLRLDPSVDVDRLPGLTPIARMVAHAAQDYGFIVTDKGGAVAVVGESGAAEQAVTGKDPWTALEDGVPDYAILKNFPWKSLQAMVPNWGES